MRRKKRGSPGNSRKLMLDTKMNSSRISDGVIVKILNDESINLKRGVPLHIFEEVRRKMNSSRISDGAIMKIVIGWILQALVHQ